MESLWSLTGSVARPEVRNASAAEQMQADSCVAVVAPAIPVAHFAAAWVVKAETIGVFHSAMDGLDAPPLALAPHVAPAG